MSTVDNIEDCHVVLSTQWWTQWGCATDPNNPSNVYRLFHRDMMNSLSLLQAHVSDDLKADIRYHFDRFHINVQCGPLFFYLLRKELMRSQATAMSQLETFLPTLNIATQF